MELCGMFQSGFNLSYAGCNVAGGVKWSGGWGKSITYFSGTGVSTNGLILPYTGSH